MVERPLFADPLADENPAPAGKSPSGPQDHQSGPVGDVRSGSMDEAIAIRVVSSVSGRHGRLAINSLICNAPTGMNTKPPDAPAQIRPSANRIGSYAEFAMGSHIAGACIDFLE